LTKNNDGERFTFISLKLRELLILARKISQAVVINLVTLSKYQRSYLRFLEDCGRFVAVKEAQESACQILMRTDGHG